jgi:hypothetical protein
MLLQNILKTVDTDLISPLTVSLLYVLHCQRRKTSELALARLLAVVVDQLAVVEHNLVISVLFSSYSSPWSLVVPSFELQAQGLIRVWERAICMRGQPPYAKARACHRGQTGVVKGVRHNPLSTAFWVAGPQQYS